MNEIKIFENAEFGQIRATVIDGKPWICGMDAARALGYTDVKNTVRKKVNEEYRMVAKMATITGEHDTTFINEAGLYQLIFGSKLESAKHFQKWVFEEVLPDIRQHGMYMTGEKIVEMMADPDKALEMLIDYAKERKERLRLEQVIKDQQPKVELADTISGSPDGILIKQMAHLLTQNGFKTGQNRLFELLRNDGFLRSAKGARFNAPTQKVIEQGLMATRESHYDDNNGVTHLSFTPLITAKGQRYFLCKYAGKVLSDEEVKSMLDKAI